MTMQFEEDVDYFVLEPLGEDLPSPIKIVRPPYDGVILMYGRVSIEEPTLDNPRMMFTYQLLETGDHTKEELESSDDFRNFLGDLLRDMILDAGNIRTHNTKKPNME